MSFWSGQTLSYRARSEGLIKPFDADSVECSSYALHVGNEAFVTRDRRDQSEELNQGSAPGHLIASDEGSISIPSGQFAFLIAKETIRIPDDTIGFISLKTWKKFHGLVNVSGFHVDPGWSGRLIFAVFNAGPLLIIIKPDDPLFLLFFASLTEEAEKRFLYHGNSNFSRIPAFLMEEMSAPVPSIYKLNNKVADLIEKVKIAELRSNIAIVLAGLVVTVSIALVIRIIFSA